MKYVPKEQVASTPIFLLATAGVRLLESHKRNALLAEVCSYARKTTDFQLPDCDLHIQAIPGETEGLYGWIAANYLLGGFNSPELHNHGKNHHTYGFLDLGGASAQIAFAPNSTEAREHADDLQLLRLRTIDGASSEYRVFVTTWLGFGVNQARNRYVSNLVEAHKPTPDNTIPDPCLPAQLEANPDYGKPDARASLIGTGRFRECMRATYPLLGKEEHCPNPPCLFHGTHVPAIDFDVNHFVGVSEYWHTTHEIFEMGHTDKAYDFETYSKRVTEFCEQDWPTIQKSLHKHKYGKKVDQETAANVCFKASWLINLLHEGIGIPRPGLEKSTSGSSRNTTKEMLGKAKQEGYLDPFQAVNKIDNTEVSWTLGKMVLYAASQIPPSDESESVAVGFGSNTANGLPNNFQHAGGRPDPPRPLDTPPGEISPPSPANADSKPQADKTESWKPSDILNSTSTLPRRTPGILLILLILLLVFLLLLGRDRRNSLFRKVFQNPFSRSRRRGGPGKPGLGGGRGLFSRRGDGSGKYERVLEEGMPHPGEFELGALSNSNSSEDDGDSVRTSGSGSNVRSSRKRGKVGGGGTPRVRASPSIGGGAGIGDYFGRGAGAVGLGLSGMKIDGSSREEFGAGTGHASRAGSPAGRLRSPGVGCAFKESVD